LAVDDTWLVETLRTLPNFRDWRSILVDNAPAGSPNGVPLRDSMAEVKHWAIHHSAAPPQIGPYEIYQYHKSRREPDGTLWAGIGYHFCIGQDGTIHYTRNVGQWGINVAGKNDQVVGICLLGDFTNALPTEAQLSAAQFVCQTLDRFVASVQGTDLIPLPRTPHRALNPGRTECPGQRYQEWIDRLNPALAPVPVPAPDESQRIAELEATVDRLSRALRTIQQIADDNLSTAQEG